MVGWLVWLVWASSVYYKITSVALVLHAHVELLSAERSLLQQTLADKVHEVDSIGVRTRE